MIPYLDQLNDDSLHLLFKLPGFVNPGCQINDDSLPVVQIARIPYLDAQINDALPGCP